MVSCVCRCKVVSGVCNLCVVLVMKVCCVFVVCLSCVSKLFKVCVSGWIFCGMFIFVRGCSEFMLCVVILVVVLCIGVSFWLIVIYDSILISGNSNSKGIIVLIVICVVILLCVFWGCVICIMVLLIWVL